MLSAKGESPSPSLSAQVLRFMGHTAQQLLSAFLPGALWGEGASQLLELRNGVS